LTTERRLFRIPLRGACVVLGERTLVMGILNVTPDSFAGGSPKGNDAALAHGLRLFEEGADWVDVGGESTRPGAEPVAEPEELRRVVPVIEALRRRGAGPLSVDTTKAAVAAAAGVPREHTLLDPGIGFSKDAGHSLETLRRLPELASLERPLLVGPSRKSFIGRVLDLPVGERLMGTAAAVAACVLGGAHIVRVHDVAPMTEVVRMCDAIRGERAA
jgi:dihydropteroate synthase